MIVTKITDIAKLFWKEHINDRDIVLDATLGNGNDSLFLSKLVGSKGKVYSMDIQKKALDMTREKMDSSMSNINLIQDSHENLDKYIKEKLSLVVFNLGYLPGENNEITTKSKSTLIALEKSMMLLKKGGIVSVAAYRGHDNGEEYIEVFKFLSTLDPKKYKVSLVNPINQSERAPRLFLCQKMKED